MAQIYVGTSGWSYEGWKGSFYPKNIGSSEFLEIYADSFKATELNNSFYSLPSKSSVDTWRKNTPKNFLFSIKASRYATHHKKLKDPGDSTEKFLKLSNHLATKQALFCFNCHQTGM